MAHPIRPDSYIEMNNFYTHTVYIKGAEVIRMLETIIGKRTFNQGVRHYLKKHDGQAVTCEDFVVAMEEVSGKDLTNFRHWYSQSGTPVVEVSGVYAEESGLFTLEFEQSCPSTPGQTHKLPFYIPVTLGLLDSSGETVELTIDSEHTNLLFDFNATKSEITVFLDVPHQKISFKGLTKMPIPSLLRGFSAPVKLEYDYTSHERLQLISSDSDPYVKWQANQELVKTVVDSILKSHDSDAMDHSAIEVILTSRRAIIADQSIDPAFKALQIELPSLLEISETYLPIPIQQLSDIWPEFKRRIATALLPELTSLADDCQQQLTNPELSQSDAAQWRRLLVSTLMLAAASGDAAIHARAEKLYHSEQSMTIKQGMLSLIHHSYTAQSDDILQHFYDAWQDEDLVIDKWFTIQSTLSSDDIFERMQTLTSHADFNLNNPNKVRSVLMRFAMANPSKFHDESGRGYELISRYVVKLNKINPQVAARLCGAFNGWRKLECESRKKMIQKSLEFILSHENTSPDVFEIANKALAD
jgi:aminopeptidase N